MSDAKYIVTGTDPLNPLSTADREKLRSALSRFLDNPDERVFAISEPVEVYEIVDGKMAKVTGDGPAPFYIDDETMLVPISEKADNYSYSGFELWRLTGGQWLRVERDKEEAQPQSWRDRPPLA